MDGPGTTAYLRNSPAADRRNHNVPGDGKFDQSYTPAKLALEVGRVDLAHLSTFPTSEKELLRQYLNKDHNFRHKIINATFRGLINDSLGDLSGGVPAVNGWGNFAPMFGAANVSSGRWLTDLRQDAYLWAYGCGFGTYTSAASVVDSLQLIVYDTR